jgi:hypothetical protein
VVRIGCDRSPGGWRNRRENPDLLWSAAKLGGKR